MAGAKGRKIGRGKRKPSTARWKANYNTGKGLKHRRMKRQGLKIVQFAGKAIVTGKMQ